MTNTPLQLANAELRAGNYLVAIDLYEKLLDSSPALEKVIVGNINFANKKIGRAHLPNGHRKLEGIRLTSQAPEFPKIEKAAEATKGAFNTYKISETQVFGWLTNAQGEQKCEATLRIDGEVSANIFGDKQRNDLGRASLLPGLYGFVFQLPNSCLDGREHRLELIAVGSGKLINKTTVRHVSAPKFEDFDGMITRSYVDPMLLQPFTENQKRALAFCDVLAKNYAFVSHGATIKVSVLMAAYNRANIVRRAMDSIIDQTYQNWELIVIDDGSTDGTAAVAETYDDPRIKVISLATNAGKAAAINKGLQSATGEWIAYLDTDNWWAKNYLAAMMGAAMISPEVNSIYSGQALYRGGNVQPYAVRICAYNKNLLLNRNYIDHNSFMHRKSLIEKIGVYDESLRRCLDYDFIIRASEYGVMKFAPLVLTHYYYDAVDNSITGDATLHGDVVEVIGRAQRLLLATPPLSGADAKAVSVRQKMVGARVSIVIPSYESLEDLQLCIASIEASEERADIDIIVVDNDSSAEVIDYLQQKHDQGHLLLIKNEKNYGFTYAVNKGVEAAAPGNDIVLLNNDARLVSGSIRRLSEYASSLHDAGLLVPAQILPPGTETMLVHVPYMNDKLWGDVNVSAHHNNLKLPPDAAGGDVCEIDFAPFFCVYIPRRTIDSIGLLDAELGRHYRSDRLYCNSVRSILRKKIYYVSTARVIHGLQKSTKVLGTKDATVYKSIFQKNQWTDEEMESLGYIRMWWDA